MFHKKGEKMEENGLQKIKEQIEEIKKNALELLEKPEIQSLLGEIKVKYLGKAGLLTAILRGMKEVAPELRPEVGALVNEARNLIEERIAKVEEFLAKKELEIKLANEKVDITEPAKGMKKGGLHPISIVINKLVDACVDMGFEVVQGPEVETDFYNFEQLNIPKNHPSRDMQDSFYITENLLLRTHTSPMQARVMEKQQPPIKIVVPGRVYRNDSDSTHSPMFHQMEGLVVDEKISMVDLKTMLNTLMKRVYGDDVKIRFRPSFFPFTEPSVEVDVSCPNCNGKGCKTCKGTGYLEILGAGIVNPIVLEKSGIDSTKYSGFAFGMGIERTAMVKFGVPDLRTMYKNDVRFLNQMK